MRFLRSLVFPDYVVDSLQEVHLRKYITFLLLLVCVATWLEFNVLQRGPKQRGPLGAASAAADGNDGDH